MLLARQAADVIEYWQSHALRQSAERMQRAISVKTVGTVFFNVQGRVNAANDTFLRMSRYSREQLEQEEMRWLEMMPPKFASIFVDVLTVRVQPKTLQSPTESANRYERQGHAKTPHTGPNIVKVSTMEEGPRSDDLMMKASSGRSPAPWRFREIARGTVVIEHPGKAAPARAAPGTDCATQEEAIAAQWLRSTSDCMGKASVRERTQARHR